MRGGILSRKVKVSNSANDPLFVTGDGGSASNIEQDFSDGNVSAVKAVYATVNGVALANDNVDFEQASVIGITRTGAIDGDKITYQIDGKFEDSSLVFALGAQIYLGVNGGLTITPPVVGFRTAIGTMSKIGTMNINIEEPIIL